jgi:hypothetical protein
MIIKGIPSGDGECWCFLVDKKTFMEVTGEAPKKWDLGRQRKGSPYRYMLNPATLIDQFDKQLGGKIVTLSVEAKLDE